MPVFVEISIIVFIATVLSLLMKLLRQPLVVGYILSGVVAGPLVLGLIESQETLELFSKLGITILLFIIGLHLNPKVVREVGGVAVVTGLGQIVFTVLSGLVLSWGLGFSLVASLFIAVALTFSSTIIVLKLLADKNHLGTLYGKVTTGFLLVQDIVASLILLAISVLSQTGQGAFLEEVGLILLQGLGLLTILFAVSKYILPRLVKFAASNQETLFVFCLAWGMGVAALFHAIGLSIEIGALVAGMALSVTTFAHEMSSRLKPLRDFFIVLFFILLGSQMSFGNIVNLLVPAVAFSIFVLIGNPIIVYVLMNLLGYHKRTSFFAGLTVAQISEFSLILVKLGQEVGYLDAQVVSLVTFVGLITIALSSYMMIHADWLYELCVPILGWLSIRDVKRDRTNVDESFEVVLFGHGRVGKDYLRMFKKLGLKYIVVDFDPKVIAQLQAKGVACVYGDADDAEFLSELNFGTIKLVVSTISDFETDLLLVRDIRRVNAKGVVIVKTGSIDHALELYGAGATYVVMPHYLGAEYAQRMISKRG